MSSSQTQDAPLALSRIVNVTVLEPRDAIRRLEIVMTKALNPEALEVLLRLNRFNLPFSCTGKVLAVGTFEVGERIPLSSFPIDVSLTPMPADVALSYAVQVLEDPKLRGETVGRYGLPIVCIEPIKSAGEHVISFGVKKGPKKQPFISLSAAKSLPEACGLKYCPLYGVMR